MEKESSVRMESDALGEIAIPSEKLWGAQTQRAVENFPISGERFDRRFIAALGEVKRACARANVALGLLDARRGSAIERACAEVVGGEWDAHFPIDIFQTGSGTSTNMNANEVIANRAIQLLGGEVGDKSPVHPNDHVNLGQSSNDVMPTALHVAAARALRDDLRPELERLQGALAEKAAAFDDIVKCGRTHLQDATPIRLGQEFGGYAAQVTYALERLRQAQVELRPLPLGGTAVGTGLNRHPDLPARAIDYLNEALDFDFVEADNHVAANASRDEIVAVSGILRAVAVALGKIANDLRWLGSGPRNGLGELQLPAVQPGSSIMPGKVNPVLAEALLMVVAQVIGYDTAITQCGLGGNFELNTMLPLMAHNLLRGIDLLANATRAFTERSVVGITVNVEHCQATAARTLALATALAPVIGYDGAAEIAKEAHRSGRTIRAVAGERTDLSPERLDELLDPRAMTEPG